jgi:hypothetical protein
MKKRYSFVCLLALSFYANAQNVGINTTNPQATLDVKGNYRFGGNSQYMSFDSLSGKIGWTNTYLFAPVSQALMKHSAAADGLFYNNSGGVNGQLEYRNAAGNAVFYTNFTNGNGYFKDNLGIGNLTPAFPISFGPALGDKISLWSNSTNSYGFGIQGSLLQIHTDISAADIAFGYGSSSAFTEKMRIKGSGNVGVGIAAPLERMHIAGNLKADTVKPSAFQLTTNAGVGKVLTSDGAGNANWQQAAASSGTGVGFGSWGDCSTNGISGFNPIADTSGAFDDYFGYSVSVSGNFAIAGAYQDDPGGSLEKGSVNIYQFNGTNWALTQKITDPAGNSTDYFGYSVSISGNYAIIGAPVEDGPFGIYQGSVSIYHYNGSSWVFMQKITDATGELGEAFGYSVSISGNYAIVGAYSDDGIGGSDVGSASIYQFNGSSWVLMQKLTDSAPFAFDTFGSSVAISGNKAIVGAPLDDGAAGPDQGSVSIYQYNGSTWVLIQKLIDATPGGGDRFGQSVGVSGNYFIVGASRDDEAGGVDQGSASIYQYNGTSLTLMTKLTNPLGAADDYFGLSVSISDSYAIVGAGR